MTCWPMTADVAIPDIQVATLHRQQWPRSRRSSNHADRLKGVDSVCPSTAGIWKIGTCRQRTFNQGQFRPRRNDDTGMPAKRSRSPFTRPRPHCLCSLGYSGSSWSLFRRPLIPSRSSLVASRSGALTRALENMPIATRASFMRAVVEPVRLLECGVRKGAP